ncbi:DUF2207 domain-containing protein [Mycobacteroides franklinii]|uniref:DUF2207 domain-containing protein n=1 Tax=Mycobacteroides franklinii TaxID=948102 RepID=A0A4R5PDP2_9MYCO|nr:hypothetical protein BST24_00005 [Mycobacteroides franklinii]TDH22935.1 DUF2207 domain-containing protein [Mycobacteroides franklinii]
MVAATLIATVIAAGVLLWPVLEYLGGTDSSAVLDPVIVTDYRADLSVDREGTLTATETLTGSFPDDRHGIFRFWDVRDPSDDHVRLIPYDIKVTRDGHDEPTDLVWQQGRAFRVAKIGDPDRTLTPGEHVYVISYRIRGVLSPSTAGAAARASGSWPADRDRASFYWKVVAGGWQVRFDRTEVRVKLPTPATDVRCAYGYDDSGQCELTGVGTDSLTIRTGVLAPRTPVTIRAAQDLPAPDRVSLPWTPPYDGVLGQSRVVASGLGILALIGLGVGWAWSWRGREEPPGYPVAYEPPPGLGPVQTCYVMREQVPANALVATLLHQAQRGLTTIRQTEGSTWRIEAQGGDWDGVDRVTRQVGLALGVQNAGGAFGADGSVTAGSTLRSTSEDIAEDTKAWARGEGLVTNQLSEQIGRFLVLAAWVVAVLLVFIRPGGATIWALPFLGFGIGGMGLLFAEVETRRTAKGREQWARAGGFYRLLSTPSAQDRFDFSAQKDLYTAFVPYAVAFGCADEWAKKYKLSTGQEPPAPSWYFGPTTPHGLFGGSTAFAGFESSLRSSIGAYEASQSSSSSGGGFSFSGGGGGGGGGGSW